MNLKVTQDIFNLLQILPTYIDNKLYFPNSESLRSDYIHSVGIDKNFSSINLEIGEHIESYSI